MSDHTPEERAFAVANGIMHPNGMFIRDEGPAIPLWLRALTDRLFAMHAARLGIEVTALMGSPRGGLKKSFTSAQNARVDMVKALRRAGATPTQAAALVGSHTVTVRRWLGID